MRLVVETVGVLAMLLLWVLQSTGALPLGFTANDINWATEARPSSPLRC